MSLALRHSTEPALHYFSNLSQGKIAALNIDDLICLILGNFIMGVKHGVLLTQMVQRASLSWYIHQEKQLL